MYVESDDRWRQYCQQRYAVADSDRDGPFFMMTSARWNAGSNSERLSLLDELNDIEALLDFMDQGLSVTDPEVKSN